MSELLNGGCRAGRPRRKHAGRKGCALLMLLAMCLAAACAWGSSFVFGGPSSRLEEFPRRSQEPIVAPLYQNPEYPSGCEAFSLAMCLRSMGYSVEPSALIDTYMPTDPTWSDFVNHFAGDARSSGSAMPPAVVVCADAYAAAVDTALSSPGAPSMRLQQLSNVGTPCSRGSRRISSHRAFPPRAHVAIACIGTSIAYCFTVFKVGLPTSPIRSSASSSTIRTHSKPCGRNAAASR